MSSNFVRVTVTDNEQSAEPYTTVCTREQADRWHPGMAQTSAEDATLEEIMSWLQSKAEGENDGGLMRIYERVAAMVSDLAGFEITRRLMLQIAEEGGL